MERLWMRKMNKKHLIIFFIALWTSVASLLYSEEVAPKSTKIAAFAGGCFWCMQKDFDDVPGVLLTTVGYTGGELVNPSYNDVSSGKTGHVEAVQVIYNPEVVTYKQLLNVYFHSIDPTDDKGQFCDRGSQYRPVIFTYTQKQGEEALKYREQLMLNKPFKEKIRVAITKAGPFYPAENYHQNYYRKHPFRYQFYRFTCGRDQRLKQLWGSQAGRQDLSPSSRDSSDRGSSS